MNDARHVPHRVPAVVPRAWGLRAQSAVLDMWGWALFGGACFVVIVVLVCAALWSVADKVLRTLFGEGE